GGSGVANLRDAPAEWSLQFERLGLAQRDSGLRICRLQTQRAATASEASRHHTFSAPGTGFFAAETEVRIRPSALPETQISERRIGTMCQGSALPLEGIAARAFPLPAFEPRSDKTACSAVALERNAIRQELRRPLGSSSRLLT